MEKALYCLWQQKNKPTFFLGYHYWTKRNIFTIAKNSNQTVKDPTNKLTALNK